MALAREPEIFLRRMGGARRKFTGIADDGIDYILREERQHLLRPECLLWQRGPVNPSRTTALQVYRILYTEALQNPGCIQGG